MPTDDFNEKTNSRVSQKEGRDIRGGQTEEDQTAAVQLSNIVNQAISSKATDIHLEVEENGPKLRYRINGILYEFPAPSAELYSRVISRLKVLSDLDVSEKRIPQSGYASYRAGDRKIDMRISIFPSIFGESSSIRVLDRNNIVLGFDRLGFSPEILPQYLRLLELTSGMVLVTGPTGGGKTTTLYASLNKIRNGRKKVITLEDPVEYHIAGVTQGQINPKAGFTFAAGLRSILRQDPNVVMVGEIRDTETAATAMQISLTGQMVFATLHTNTAPGAVTRLLDMGIEPYLAGSSLVGVINQTLVGHICQKCKEEYQPDPDILVEAAGDLEKFGKIKFLRGKGCPNCNQSGYQGRIGLYELMVINSRLRATILRKPSTEEVTGVALESGMITIRQDGLKKVAEGIVTIEDMVQVTRRE
ncbi:MAG: GspE/PulE family protein [Candidatus Ratteibacteria bacterium]|jgi:type II secretory ATPase GspE/PulE/Tfp pilus assembly ATPase PilB-like protein